LVIFFIAVENSMCAPLNLAGQRNLDSQILQEVVSLVENAVWCVSKWVWVKKKRDRARTNGYTTCKSCTHKYSNSLSHTHTNACPMCAFILNRIPPDTPDVVNRGELGKNGRWPHGGVLRGDDYF
jgi:hypothetical protein